MRYIIATALVFVEPSMARAAGFWMNMDFMPSVLNSFLLTDLLLIALILFDKSKQLNYQPFAIALTSFLLYQAIWYTAFYLIWVYNKVGLRATLCLQLMLCNQRRYSLMITSLAAITTHLKSRLFWANKQHSWNCLQMFFMLIVVEVNLIMISKDSPKYGHSFDVQTIQMYIPAQNWLFVEMQKLLHYWAINFNSMFLNDLLIEVKVQL